MMAGEICCFVLVCLVSRCSVKKVVSAVIIGLIVAGVIAGAITAAVLLTSNKQSKTNSKDVVLRWNTVGITVAGQTGVSGNTSTTLSGSTAIALDYSITL